MDHELSILYQAVRAAGDAIFTIQHAGLSITFKSHNEIVTEADVAANEILRAQLIQHFPSYGWLSEESEEDARRLTCHRTWVVDPIDGTIEFARGIPEYAISVALVERGVPIVAMILNPATNECFHAVSGKGAYLNNTLIHCRSKPKSEMLLLASRSEYQRGAWDAFKLNHIVQPMGSIAYKLGLVAAGRAQATFSLGAKNEWDIAAGALIVSEAGGKVTDSQQQTIVFNQPTVLVNGIVAAAAENHAQICEIIHSTQ